MATTYNGHSSWAAWNVALWIGNDEGLYLMARALYRETKSAKRAARALQQLLPAKTPDGARYSLGSLTKAIAGLEG